MINNFLIAEIVMSWGSLLKKLDAITKDLFVKRKTKIMDLMDVILGCVSNHPSSDEIAYKCNINMPLQAHSRS